MKIITHTNGTTLAFGFNMLDRCPDQEIVSFDNGDNCWDAERGGGSVRFRNRAIAPEFVIEHDGRILAYQPGLLMELSYVGHPMGWSIRFYRANSNV